MAMVEYCSLCGKSFCAICETKYAERIEAMIKEKLGQVKAKIFGR